MPPLSIEQTVHLSTEALFRELSGESVILDLNSGTYFGLNAVGTRIWQLVEEHGRLQVVLDALRREYDANPDRLEQELLDLVARLVEVRLASVAP